MGFRLALLSLIAFTTTNVTSQTTPHYVDRAIYESGNESGLVGITPDTVVWWTPGSGAALTSLHGITGPTSLCALENGTFLIAAYDERSNTSFLATTLKSGGSILTSSSSSYVGHAFEKVIWHHELDQLFALDSKNGRLLAAPLTAPWNLPPPSSVSVAATQIDIPILELGPGALRLSVAGNNSIQVCVGGLGDTSMDAWLLEYDAQSGTYKSTHEVVSDPPSDDWVISTGYAGNINARAATITIGGGPGPYVIQERYTGQVVATGTTLTTDFQTINTGPLLPGGVYTLETPGSDTPQYAGARAVSRWGTPSKHAEYYMFEVDTPSECESGNADFAVTGRVSLSQLSALSTADMECYLWIGINDGAPVTEYADGTAVINTLIGTVGPFSATATKSRGAMYVKLPLPPPGGGLDFAEILFQFVAIRDLDFVVSDVAGVKLPPPIGVTQAATARNEGSASTSQAFPMDPAGVVVHREVQAVAEPMILDFHQRALRMLGPEHQFTMSACKALARIYEALERESNAAK